MQDEQRRTELAHFLRTRRDRLMQASPEFRQWWSRHDIGAIHVSQKELNHPRVGMLVLQPTALFLADDPNLKLFLYTPLAQTDTAKKLSLLANTGSRHLAPAILH